MAKGYCALFVTGSEVCERESTPLCREVLDKHITYSFNVTKEEAKEIMPLGTEVYVVVTGYACDGSNSGFRVEIPEGYTKSKNGKDGVTPHITMSLSTTGKAVDTAKLEFKDIEPFTVKAVYGFYDFATKEVSYNYIPRIGKDKIEAIRNIVCPESNYSNIMLIGDNGIDLDFGIASITFFASNGHVLILDDRKLEDAVYEKILNIAGFDNCSFTRENFLPFD